MNLPANVIPLYLSIKVGTVAWTGNFCQHKFREQYLLHSGVGVSNDPSHVRTVALPFTYVDFRVEELYFCIYSNTSP